MRHREPDHDGHRLRGIGVATRAIYAPIPRNTWENVSERSAIADRRRVAFSMWCMSVESPAHITRRVATAAPAICGITLAMPWRTAAPRILCPNNRGRGDQRGGPPRLPGFRLEQDRHDHPEKELREAGMDDGQRLGVQQFDQQAPHRRLCQNGRNRQPRQRSPRPDCQDDGEHRDGQGQHPVAELVANAAFQRRNEFPPSQRPIRYRQGGIVAGDQSAGNHQQKSTHSHRHRKAAQPLIPHRLQMHPNWGRLPKNLPLISLPFE